VLGGPARDAKDEEEERRGIREIFNFWRDYFRDVLKLSDAESRERATEMATISMQDDVDIMDLIELL
jgi:hypothetical protein